MRLTLRRQITTALVLFGLVPAAIVAAFAFLSNEDFKDKQKILVRQAAQYRQRRARPGVSPEKFRGAETFDRLNWIPKGTIGR